MENKFVKNNWVFIINKIAYMPFKSVCIYTIFKCYIKMLKHRHLTMRGVLDQNKSVPLSGNWLQKCDHAVSVS